MHQEYDQDNVRLRKEIIQADTEEKLNKRLSELHSQALNNPNVTRIVQSKIGRNDICPCGSGKKFKKCCLVTSAVVVD